MMKNFFIIADIIGALWFTGNAVAILSEVYTPNYVAVGLTYIFAAITFIFLANEASRG